MDALFDLTLPTVFILINAVLVVGFWGEIRSDISSFLTRKPKNMDLNPLADVIGFFFLLAVFSLIWACVAARTAACSGWLNPSVSIGLILSVFILYLIYKSFSKILWNYKIVTLVISLCFAVLLTAFSSFISPALHNFTEVDEYHHPVFVPVNNEWINALSLSCIMRVTSKHLTNEHEGKTRGGSDYPDECGMVGIAPWCPKISTELPPEASKSSTESS